MPSASKNIFFLICLCLWSLQLSAAENQQRLAVGQVSKLKNQAQAVYRQSIRQLQLAAPVMADDLLQTAEDSRLKIGFEDGSDLVLGEQTEVRIDRFVYTPKQDRNVVMNSVKGALRFIGNSALHRPGDNISIKTPVATLGIRGTDVWLGPTEDGTGVLVLEGKVEVRSRAGMVSLRAGEGTTIGDDGSLAAAKTWGSEKRDQALSSVRF